MEWDFPQLIGIVIHHCAALELDTNNAIMGLSRDSLLASEMVKSPFSRRIAVLRSLLTERTKLPPSEIKSLCDELRDIAKLRNAIAHNPISRDDPQRPESERILVVRHTPGKAQVNEINRNELASLVDRTAATMRKFSELVPTSRKI